MTLAFGHKYKNEYEVRGCASFIVKVLDNASSALLPGFLLIVCLCSGGYAGISAATDQKGAEKTFWDVFYGSPCVKPGQGWVMVPDNIVPLEYANTHHCYPAHNSATPVLSQLLNEIACHRACKSADNVADSSTSSLSQYNDRVRVRIFHWHLSSSSSNTSRSTQLQHIQSDLADHLRRNKLKPDILVFTGTEWFAPGSRNEQQWESLCNAITTELGDPEHLPPLDKRCQNPFNKGHRVNPDSYTYTHFIHKSEIAIISLLPIRLLHSEQGASGMGCGLYSENNHLVQFAYTLFLTVRFNDLGLKMMISSSEDDGVNYFKSIIGKNTWQYCMQKVLKPLLEEHISDTEPMIAISHISSNSFNHKMMTRLIRGSSAKRAGEKELETLVNSQARYYAGLYNALSKDPRISHVMSRKGYSENKKGRFRRSSQIFYAFRKAVPDTASYLDYLYYILSYLYSGASRDYAPMYPSYTTFTIDSTLLEKMPELPEHTPENTPEPVQPFQLEHPFMTPLVPPPY
ncbi:hypothetical protein V5J37_000062 [Endozoicomonas sp. NE43]